MLIGTRTSTSSVLWMTVASTTITEWRGLICMVIDGYGWLLLVINNKLMADNNDNHET